MNIQYRKPTLEQAASSLLAQDKKKILWRKMPFASLPDDLAAMAQDYLDAELLASSAKARLQSAFDDKVEAPPGKRLIVTLGRALTESTNELLVAWVEARASSTTASTTFDQFVTGR